MRRWNVGTWLPAVAAAVAFFLVAGFGVPGCGGGEEASGSGTAQMTDIDPVTFDITCYDSTGSVPFPGLKVQVDLLDNASRVVFSKVGTGVTDASGFITINISGFLPAELVNNGKIIRYSMVVWPQSDPANKYTDPTQTLPNPIGSLGSGSQMNVTTTAIHGGVTL